MSNNLINQISNSNQSDRRQNDIELNFYEYEEYTSISTQTILQIILSSTLLFSFIFTANRTCHVT
jgi:hypothetical protein